jgi:hypothetical protein
MKTVKPYKTDILDDKIMNFYKWLRSLWDQLDENILCDCLRGDVGNEFFAIWYKVDNMISGYRQGYNVPLSKIYVFLEVLSHKAVKVAEVVKSKSSKKVTWEEI